MESEEYVLQLDLHQSSRASSLLNLWKKEAFLDVTIACDDDQIEAHKLILSAASPLFQKMLLRNQNVTGRHILYLKGTRKNDMKSLLEFVYNGEVSIQPNDIKDFMELASSLEIQGLHMNKIKENDSFNEMKNSANYYHEDSKSYTNYSYEMDIKDSKIIFSDVDSVAQINNKQISVLEDMRPRIPLSSDFL